jgi:hypothetical protein
MVKNDNSQLMYLTGVAVVAVVAILVLNLNGSNINTAVTYDRQVIDDYQTSCTDSDSFNDFFVSGSVKFQKYQYNDFCKGDKLFQVQCASSNRFELIHGYDCPNGCLNGACVR